MKTELDAHGRSMVAMTVAPEDLHRGDFVAILNEVLEVPSCCWLDLPAQRPEEPVRVRFMAPDSGTPVKVQALCLPFVFVRHPDGWTETLDVRRVQLVHVSCAYARAVWKAARKDQERRRRQCP